MSRSTNRIRVGVGRRVLVAVGIGFATMAAASGCAAGQIAATAEIVPAVQGSSGMVGSVALRDVKLAYPQGGQYQQGQDARLTLVMVNNGLGDDALTSVRTDAADDVTFQAGNPTGTDSATPSESASGSPTASASASETPEAGQQASIPLPANENVLAYADGPRITLLGLTRDLRSSETVKVTFSFRDAGNITLVVPVAVPSSPVPQPPAIDVSPTAQD